MAVSYVEMVGGEVSRPPITEQELYHWVRCFLGTTLVRTQVCPEHQAPFDAFANAYFARDPVTVWYASRGFGGKSWMLATLALTEAITMAAKVNVLGGSAAQSTNVLEHMDTMLYYRNAPRYLIEHVHKFEVKLIHGNTVRALMASPTSVRGPHPSRLRLDEIDEMEMGILDSAMGMPMTQGSIQAQTVMSSTLQYPNGTMRQILDRAGEKGWPTFTWCYLESSNPLDGWLTQDEIDSKRLQVSEEMFRVEYDLQAPAIEGRAINSKAVERMFDPNLGTVPGEPGVEYRFEQPEEHARYVHGIDWGRKKDWTVIDTWRTDVTPWRRVAWQRVQRRPWPEMVATATQRLQDYGGVLAHDATGLGDVVASLFPEHMRWEAKRIDDVILSGSNRANIFSECIAAVEQGGFVSPLITWHRDELLYCTVDDLFRSGEKFHPPDSFVALALGWYARMNQTGMVAPVVDELSKPRSGWEVPGDRFVYRSEEEEHYWGNW